jgi:serine protease Do
MKAIVVAALVLLTGSVGFAQPMGGKELISLPSLAPLVDSVKAAVVNVDVVSRGGPVDEDDEMGEGGPFGPFMGTPQGRPQLRRGMGSGFVIDPKGYVLTNNHVVAGATSIQVRFDDGRKFQGEVMGRDEDTDIAVVKLKGNASNLPFVKLGDSDAMKVGDWVVAIGNPFGLASSVSLGIVSARAREIEGMYDNFLQTDAAINPGNSGGPLFNLKGEVVGINVAIVRQASGIGFAVPSNFAKALVPQLEKGKTVVRGFMGVATQKVTPEIAQALKVPVSEGVVVYSVEKGSPAQTGGLRQDDVIVAVDGHKVDSQATLRRLVGFKAPGAPMEVSIYRGNEARKLTVTLVTRPKDEIAQRERSAVEVNPDEGAHRAIGLRATDMNPMMAKARGLPTQGALITEVAPGSPAENADLAPQMVVVEANHQPIRGAMDLKRILQSAKPGSSIVMRVAFPESHGAQLRVLEKPS